MMAARTMHMAVRQLFFGRGTHADDLYLEVQILAGERVIAVERHHVTLQMSDGHSAHAVLRLSMQLHADMKIPYTLERPTRHLLDQRLVEFAIAVGRRDFHIQLVAFAL